ncbi:serine hydrolase domain-containing protein [Paenibacillus azoreducens]|uniref:Penicillin-binding protein n=1 Tax=Paenibacillus azoreducens TaxID=116718 RepID=A0A919YAB7_9BACL|nr:serine hydrolase domain-containing protein [Paenibacillus azoreducens]GIO45305.1 penicillin-binding protein [Paenibacillus azoreducens]
MNINIEDIVNQPEQPFSGSIWIGSGGQASFEMGYGFANRNEMIRNTPLTRFGVASGSKIFTAVAICQLAEKGLLRFDTLLKDCLEGTFPDFDPAITIHHLLTHSSGIPDYFDEETMSDYGELWRLVPMYGFTSPAHFLPLFKDKRMKFAPGERFSYSNAGYIVLGLIIEKVTGISFQRYVEENIFRVSGMKDSGYFRLDQLPERTAHGYIDNDGEWKTNIYSIPVIGGADGGAFTTGQDMNRFWGALMEYRLLSRDYTEILLSPQIKQNEHIHYGYGVWIVVKQQRIFKYFVMGSDPGVEMHSSVYPKTRMRAHILANVEHSAGMIARRLDEVIFSSENEEHAEQSQL